MKIVQLTPGTGNFHCGNCLRDHALARALRERGHEVQTVPLYLPLVTDEPLADGTAPIFFGGINVYLQQKSRIFQHTPEWVDRLFDRPGLLRWAADHASMTSPEELGEMTLSMLRGEEGQQGKELEKLIGWLETQHTPDVTLLSNGLLLGLSRRLKAALGCPVVCFLQGEDAFLDTLPEPYGGEAWRIVGERARDVDALVAVSRYYAQTMAERLELSPEQVRVLPNGISVEGYEPAAEPPDPPTVGYLARMNRVKGLEQLVDAFIRLKQRDRVGGLRLEVAGAMTPEDEPFVEAMKERLKEADLADAASFHPNISREEKGRLLRRMSVFSVPATYGESFGLYVLEALACGVPVVQPRHAAFPELIEATDGGILCEPHDTQALSDSLESLLLQPDETKRRGERGREAVLSRFTIDRMATDLLALLGERAAARV